MPRVVKYSPKKKKFSVYQQVAKRVAATALPYAANYVMPGSGNAIRFAGMAARYLKKKRYDSAKSSVKGKKKGKKYHTTGKYVGSFKRGGRKGVNEMKEYVAKGFVTTDEIAGTISDPDCVYVVHQALDPYLVIVYSVQALVRKLLMKCGVKVSSVNEIIPGRAPEDARDWVFRLLGSQEGNSADEIIVFRIECSAGQSIASLVSIGNFINPFMQYSSGYTTVAGTGNDSNTFELTRLQVYMDNNGADQDFFIGEIDLREEIIHYNGKSELKVQNRTLAANSSADAEDVSNNPLEGRLYNFSGVPKCKVYESFALNRIEVAKGVQLVRAAQLTGASLPMKEPPLPKLFWNCIGASKVRLNPGDIKKTAVIANGSTKYLKWLKNIRLQYGASPFYSTYSIFKSQMIALEDMINIVAANNVSCAYECNRTTSIYFSTLKNTSSLGGYSYTSYSNNPAV